MMSVSLPAGFSHDYLSDTRLYVREGSQLTITFVFNTAVRDPCGQCNPRLRRPTDGGVRSVARSARCGLIRMARAQ